jgi:hypothetical protein
MGDEKKIIAYIATCEDAGKLRILIKNARNKGASSVAVAAFRKLISLVPSEQPGTVEHDFWQTIHALEYELSSERGRTTRLSRTRQKVKRDGVVTTLKELALSKDTKRGFQMLLDRGMPELTAEAIVLRHTTLFEAAVVDAARQRLLRAGMDVNTL